MAMTNAATAPTTRRPFDSTQRCDWPESGSLITIDHCSAPVDKNPTSWHRNFRRVLLAAAVKSL
ncbi:Uncharacterised protein [Mycobacteroides abscessus subsp. abscessus]|nr:Uncharacterised protein [Mycobacteroides abscessus subsp. abscessus]